MGIAMMEDVNETIVEDLVEPH
ncbi:uncharacterized protein G2W53_038514 [Senna tora]|uniref:Uncharacterized protein n=1 Tax=Senna tora TaxID=362788 RepID=A0A834SP79_9FABA|nr:uncharacterized protein G2W53_038514 [Senna tora]